MPDDLGVDLEPVVLKPNRLGSLIALGFGAVIAVVAAVMLARGNLIGLVPAALALVAIVAGTAGLVPGRASLRLDDQGFYVKSISKSFGALWVEIDALKPTSVRIGRNDQEKVVEVTYKPGIGDHHLPQHRLARGTVGIDERYVVAAYGKLSNEQLAELMERYRARYS